MKAYDIKKLSYRDKLARKNRLFFIFKVVGALAMIILVAGGGAYFLFFTDKLEIKDITLNGLQTINRDDVLVEVGKQSKNIIFFDSDELKAELFLKFPVLKSVEVYKKLPHGVSVDILERKPLGIWCVNPLADEECRYFDEEMATWGPAVKSSGFLFLTIEDNRDSDDFNIDIAFFKAIREAVANLSEATIKNIIIPENSFDEFRIYTDKSFYIILSLDTNIKNQLEVLKIFLEEKSKEPNFNPQYLDLRIDGRVYFKQSFMRFLVG